jgi:prephenate dehydrogenase
MYTVGIIGLGGFGRLISSMTPAGTTLVGFSRSNAKAPGVTNVSFAQLAATDIIIAAVPLEAYAEVLQKLKKLLRPETLVVDVCSVKERPQALFRRYLSKHPNILMTHPLFGPNSIKTGLKGHTLVVTESRGALAEKVVGYCERQLGLQVKRVSPKVHDQTMARVHALTFFVARGLARLSKAEPLFTTPSHRLVADLITLDQTRSNDLFTTIQKGNPYAQEVRQEFLSMLQTIDRELQDE